MCGAFQEVQYAFDYFLASLFSNNPFEADVESSEQGEAGMCVGEDEPVKAANGPFVPKADRFHSKQPLYCNRAQAVGDEREREDCRCVVE